MADSFLIMDDAGTKLLLAKANFPKNPKIDILAI